MAIESEIEVDNEELEKPELEQDNGKPEDKEPELEYESKVDEAGDTIIQHRPNRKERRVAEAANRTRQTVDEAIRPFASELQASRREIGELKQMLSQLNRSAGNEPMTQRAQNAVVDEYTDLSNRQTLILQAMRADNADTVALTEAYNNLERKKTESIVRSINKQSAPPQTRQTDPRMDVLRAEYGDVMEDQTAFEWAVATAKAELAVAGRRGVKALTLNEERAIMDRAATMFGIRKQQPAKASDSDKAKFTGISSSPGGGSQQPDVKLTPQQMSLAREAFPRDTPAIANAKWFKMMRDEKIL
jgi:hypothetical protein